MIKSFHEYLGEDNLVQEDYTSSISDFLDLCIAEEKGAIFEASAHDSGAYPVTHSAINKDIDFDFLVVGQGAVFFLKDGQITDNHQKMFKFTSSSRIALQIFGDITFDMNAENQMAPAQPYDLQHCHALEIQSLGVRGFEVVSLQNITIKNRIGDGIAINGKDGDIDKTLGVISAFNIQEPTPALYTRAAIGIHNSFDSFNARSCNVSNIEIEHDAIDDSYGNATVLDNCTLTKRLDINNKGSLVRPKVILRDLSVDVDNINLKTGEFHFEGGTYDFNTLTWDKTTFHNAPAEVAAVLEVADEHYSFIETV